MTMVSNCNIRVAKNLVDFSFTLPYGQKGGPPLGSTCQWGGPALVAISLVPTVVVARDLLNTVIKQDQEMALAAHFL